MRNLSGIPTLALRANAYHKSSHEEMVHNPLYYLMVQHEVILTRKCNMRRMSRMSWMKLSA